MFVKLHILLELFPWIWMNCLVIRRITLSWILLPRLVSAYWQASDNLSSGKIGAIDSMFLMNSIDFMLMGFYIMWWFSSLTVLPLAKMLLLCAIALDHNSGLALYMPEGFFVLLSVIIALQVHKKSEPCCMPVVREVVFHSEIGEKHTDPLWWAHSTFIWIEIGYTPSTHPEYISHLIHACLMPLPNFLLFLPLLIHKHILATFWLPPSYRKSCSL